MTTIYGIKNCDTVKKTLRWLDSHKVNYAFHDFRKDGLDQAKVIQWLDQIGIDTLINKRGTTWKQLPESKKNLLAGGDGIEVIRENPTLIKRPVVESGKKVTVGFNETEFQKLFNV